MSMIQEREGDLFDAPEGSALIHACNCQGSWGKGVAEAFRKKYPGAYGVYRSHCRRLLSQSEKGKILGTALLIPPQPEDYDLEHRALSNSRSQGGGFQGRDRGRGRGSSYSSTSQSTPAVASKKHWIICLFTSWHYGSKKDSPGKILESTALALRDMKRQMEENKEFDEGVEIWSCRINAGLFNVPWEQTKKTMEETELSITVVSPKESN